MVGVSDGHTREDAGSKPAAPIRKGLISRHFVGVAVRPCYRRDSAFRPAPISRSLRTADERICRASSRLTRERSPVREAAIVVGQVP